LSPERYIRIRSRIIILMVLVTFIPVISIVAINYYNYQEHIRAEIVNPLHVLTHKTKRTFELFIDERINVIQFIASVYTYKDLTDKPTLKRIYRVLKKEFGDFVDLGILTEDGIQLNYFGPYEFTGNDYSKQNWFQEVMVKGVHISDVFMGYRRFPHIVIAVQHIAENDSGWILRATIDTKKFDSIISSMSLEPENDAFLINREGIIQTHSRTYGQVMGKFPFSVAPGGYSTKSMEVKDSKGRDLYIVYAPFEHHDYVLVLIKPRSSVFKNWFTLRNEMALFFIIGAIATLLVILKLADMLVKQIKEADIKREVAFRELEHNQKLSSLGRLAAGVAHEINNPLAIIHQKAGLMKDIIDAKMQDDEMSSESGKDTAVSVKHEFLKIITSINQSINRCKAVTQRLLGFARHMDIQLEPLEISDVINDTVSFIEQEAKLRGVQIHLNFAENLPGIVSDRGQLQQVFLNILMNGLAAVEDNGLIVIRIKKENPRTLSIAIRDDGSGIADNDIRRIFEPFFTVGKEYGTGLGLPITYGIVTKLGGDIKVESKQGQGTTFTVFLPL
jgi:two-component system, NtrC family, sensor kinase